MIKPYRPRRRRSGSPPPLQITPRDIAIVQAVARYRFLNSNHITLLISGSPKNIRNRLKNLFEHGLLDRPDCQYDFYRPGEGSSPLVYALADKGAKLLMHHDGFHRGKPVSWAQKNRSVGRPFLNHTLAIADFAIRLQASMQHRADMELLAGDRLLCHVPEATRQKAKPFRLSVPVIFKSTRCVIGLEPDYVFALNAPKMRRRAHFLCEIDRGTMPIERSSLNATSIQRKFLAYSTLWRSGLHHRHFGWNNFRVLILTTNQERLQNMQACLKKHISGKEESLFWFGCKEEVELSDDVLTYEWKEGCGVDVSRSLV